MQGQSSGLGLSTPSLYVNPEINLSVNFHDFYKILTVTINHDNWAIISKDQWKTTSNLIVKMKHAFEKNLQNNAPFQPASMSLDHALVACNWVKLEVTNALSRLIEAGRNIAFILQILLQTKFKLYYHFDSRSHET